MADNCSGLEPWGHRPIFTGGFWMSEAFARDTETITRALQVSISHGSSTDHSLPPTPTLTPSSAHLKHEHPFSVSDSDSGHQLTPPGPTRKISKRKSRASKRSPTTFITADAANFREMVQQVTGVKVVDSSGGGVVETVLTRQEPERSVGRVVIPQIFLPTLDTSALLLERDLPAPTPVMPPHSQQQFVPMMDSGFGVFEIESFPCFPTLESWGVM